MMKQMLSYKMYSVGNLPNLQSWSVTDMPHTTQKKGLTANKFFRITQWLYIHNIPYSEHMHKKNVLGIIYNEK